MSSPGSAKNIKSPGRSARKSAGTGVPTRDCSRDVRGSETRDFANTYFVNPEQSKPCAGVLPPHTYLMPRYESPVRSTCAAAAEGAGDAGMRARPEELPPRLPPLPPVVGMDRGKVA